MSQVRAGRDQLRHGQEGQSAAWRICLAEVCNSTAPDTSIAAPPNPPLMLFVPPSLTSPVQERLPNVGSGQQERLLGAGG